MQWNFALQKSNQSSSCGHRQRTSMRRVNESNLLILWEKCLKFGENRRNIQKIYESRSFLDTRSFSRLRHPWRWLRSRLIPLGLGNLNLVKISSHAFAFFPNGSCLSLCFPLLESVYPVRPRKVFLVRWNLFPTFFGILNIVSVCLSRQLLNHSSALNKMLNIPKPSPLIYINSCFKRLLLKMYIE